jgi:hypothetical protein
MFDPQLSLEPVCRVSRRNAMASAVDARWTPSSGLTGRLEVEGNANVMEMSKIDLCCISSFLIHTDVRKTALIPD